MKEILYDVHQISAVNRQGESIKDARFRIFAGETLFFLGERDSGRAALFDYFRGQAEKVSGDILGENAPVKESRFYEETFLISDTDAPFNDLSGVSVLDYCFLFQNTFPSFFWSPAKEAKNAEESLKKVGLEIDVNTNITELTHTERLLVDFAKAVQQKKKLVLMQEDFEGILHEDMLKLQGVMKDLKARFQMSFLIHTNGLNGLRELADRAALFHKEHLVRIVSMQKNRAFSIIEDALYAGENMGFVKKETTNKEICRIENIVLSSHAIPSLSFNEQEIVSIIDFDLQEKLTLFRILTGQEDRGARIYLDDELLPKEWTKQLVRYPIVGIETFGIKSLFPQMSISENLSLPSYQKLQKSSPILAGSVLSAMEKEWIHQHPHSQNSIESMTRGERMALQLESWWIFHPRVLILLEPFLHLDRQGRGIIAYYFRKFKERKTTIVVLSGSSTNYLGEEAKELEYTLFDRVVLL